MEVCLNVLLVPCKLEERPESWNENRKRTFPFLCEYGKLKERDFKREGTFSDGNHDFDPGREPVLTVESTGFGPT